MLVKVTNENKLEYIKGSMSDPIDRDVYIQCDFLEPGLYYHYVELDWHPSTTEYSINCYG